MNSVTHSKREHALCSPSQAGWWLTCPGAPRLREKLQDEKRISVFKGSPATNYGEKAHELAETCIAENRIAGVQDGVGVVDKVLIDTVNTYLAFIRSEMERHNGHYIEKRLVVEGIDGLFGTVDFIGVTEKYNGFKTTVYDLTVADLKTGVFKPVRARWNRQLVIYASLFLMSYVLDGGGISPDCTVSLAISQPRVSRTPDIWKTTADAIQTVFTEEILPVSKRIVAGEGEFNPERETCRWCECKNHCPAAAQRGIA